MIESTERPVAWRYVTLIKDKGKRFNVRLAISYSRLGPMALRAVGLDAKTPTENLTLKNAILLGDKVEAFRAGQEAAKRPGKRA